MQEVLKAFIPSIGVLILFVMAFRAIVHADRRERAAVARYEAQQRTTGEPESDAGEQAPPSSPTSS